ncbi:hypothetical protein ASPVEDRAFT_156475 [Aspergillus versicolor CBS 583.65]|uniref:Uncharacterized protein n=1 Tax=Aspergillus versicolor CBS 583.65 TaxID=1036611 RepID=A0A1L9Q585_ASPVE|nr:uncharacterized protein ASPVEDRAFT_156475 [Aspergillus versicolor CBS 583.65]OJJ08891.1 hypothetical protein ASPVEDRAFT_156475 [Aspergillus versicolor CBS 583.65]
MAIPSLGDVERTAYDTIRRIVAIPELAESSLLLVGRLAAAQLVLNVECQDISILISPPKSLCDTLSGVESVREKVVTKLSETYPNLYSPISHNLLRANQGILVSFMVMRHFPWLERSRLVDARSITDTAHLPFLSPEDIITEAVFRAPTLPSGSLEARVQHALGIALRFSKQGRRLAYSRAQLSILENSIATFSILAGGGEIWWRETLSVPEPRSDWSLTSIRSGVLVGAVIGLAIERLVCALRY